MKRSSGLLRYAKVVARRWPRIRAGVVMVSVVGLGVAILVITQAATLTGSFEVEQGVGSITRLTGSGSSSNGYVKFQSSTIPGGLAYINNRGTYYATYGAPTSVMEWEASANIIWNKPLPASTPIDANSAKKVAATAKLARGQGITGVNGGSPIFPYKSDFEDEENSPNVLLVDSDRENFQKVEFNCSAGNGQWFQSPANLWWGWNKTQFETYINNVYPGKVGIPLPNEYVMANHDKAGGTYGDDDALTIYDYKKDIYFTFWVFKTRSRTGGNPQACWAGYARNFSQDVNTQATLSDLAARGFSAPNGMENPGSVAAEAMGIMPRPTGANAAGLSDLGTIITMEDIRRGSINHAIGVSMGNIDYTGRSYPANRNDGACGPDAGWAAWRDMYNQGLCLYEGQRMRLPSTYNTATISNPIARMVAEAAKKYGLVVHDWAGCVCMQSESSRARTENGQANPWSTLYAGANSYDIYAQFPWEDLQVLPKDWRH